MERANHSYPLYYEHPHDYRYKAKVVKLYNQEELIRLFPQTKAIIDSFKDEKRCSLCGIVLDRTLAYPGGGGQIADKGVIESDTTVSEHFTTVLLEDNTIIHLCDNPILEGTKVVGTIDETSRYDFQCQHSAQHLLSGIAYKNFGINTTSIYLSTNYSMIEFDTTSIDEFTLLTIQNMANSFARLNKTISSYEVDSSSLEKLNLRRTPKESYKKIRIVEIEDLDKTPCCGVHCNSTSHLVPIFITSSKCVKGKFQITFVAGSRAINEFYKYSKTLKPLLNLYSCQLDNLASEVDKERTKNSETSKMVLNLIKTIAENLICNGGDFFDLTSYPYPASKEIANQVAKKISKENCSSLIVYSTNTKADSLNFILLDFTLEEKYKSLFNQIENSSNLKNQKGPRYEGTFLKSDLEKIKEAYQAV